MDLNRREFLASGLLLAEGALLRSGAEEKPDPSGLVYRTVGRTGMRVAVVGMGAMQCSDPEVIRHAVSRGVNYIDTADCYMGGQNEKIVGEAVAAFRPQVFLATKVHIAGEAAMEKSIVRSLKSLKTDYVDLMQLHNLSSRDEVVNETAKNVLSKMKEKGALRFAGVTTHGGQEEVLRAVSEDGFYDSVLVGVNFRSPESLFGAIAEAGQKGVGVIAMKTQNGGFSGSSFPGLTPHQAALRYVLEKPGVCCAVPGMVTLKIAEENVGVMSAPAGIKAGLLLDLYRRELTGKACAFCSSCSAQCRYRAGAQGPVRIATYLDGYRDPRLAREMAGPVAESIRRCAGCQGCTVSCPQGIDIAAKARRAVEALSAAG